MLRDFTKYQRTCTLVYSEKLDNNRLCCPVMVYYDWHIHGIKAGDCMDEEEMIQRNVEEFSRLQKYITPAVIYHNQSTPTHDREVVKKMDAKEQLAAWIEESDNIVFFGGAGVSTESKIPDFRSVDGLYNQEYDYPPETILSHTFFVRQPEEFFRFYRNKMLFPDAVPNNAHKALANLERQDKLKAVITQNIDGLHQKAGSREVLELHGSVLRNYCMDCGNAYGLPDIMAQDGIPRCGCGGTIKPDVVLYEEGLDTHTLEKSISYIQNADMLIIGGTSLAVYPAAGLIDYYDRHRHHKLVLINKDKTSRDSQADLVLHAPIGEVLSPWA